ncbi:hypothetical protein GCM10027422_05260 [Hymenobacter arcticus]
MRILLLLLLCLGLGRGTAGAQSLPTALPTEALVPPALHTDTATAIHTYYRDRRRFRSRVLLATVGGGVLITLVSNAIGPAKYGSYDGAAIRFINLMFVGIPVIGGELLYFGRYSRRNERLDSEDFLAHKLPRATRERLKPKYFQVAPPK